MIGFAVVSTKIIELGSIKVLSVSLSVIKYEVGHGLSVADNTIGTNLASASCHISQRNGLACVIIVFVRDFTITPVVIVASRHLSLSVTLN